MRTLTCNFISTKCLNICNIVQYTFATILFLSTKDTAVDHTIPSFVDLVKNHFGFTVDDLAGLPKYSVAIGSNYN